MRTRLLTTIGVVLALDVHGFAPPPRRAASVLAPERAASPRRPLAAPGSRLRLPPQEVRAGLAAQDIVEAGVTIDTFAPQFLWLLMIAAPEFRGTKTVMGSNGVAAISALALVHLTVVATAAAQEGALDQILIFQEVFDPTNSQLAGMQKLFQYPNFVAEEWPHVLIWDLFVGRAIWIDGIQRGVNTRLSLLFCNLIGPPGLLIYVATCLISRKGIPTLGLPQYDFDSDEQYESSESVEAPAMTSSSHLPPWKRFRAP